MKLGMRLIRPRDMARAVAALRLVGIQLKGGRSVTENEMSESRRQDDESAEKRRVGNTVTAKVPH